MVLAPLFSGVSTARRAATGGGGGGGGGGVNGGEEREVKTYELQAENELRMEVVAGGTATITMLSGDAEILGVELALNKTYTVGDVKLPIFSWHGAKIALGGDVDFGYIFGDTPMPIYVNAFSVLRFMREKSLEDGSAGPRVLLIGPPDCGKSTLASIWTSYTVKTFGLATVVDLDFTDNTVNAPGAVAAASVQHIEVDGGALYEDPICYFYGHPDVHDNLKTLLRLVERLGDAVSERMSHSELLRASGFLANAGGWVEEFRREDLDRLIRGVRANVVVVIGAERMYADVQQVIAGRSDVEAVQLPRSGGVLRRDASTRRQQRFQRLRSYFYGAEGELLPFTTVVDYDSVTLVKVGGMPAVPASALPIGATPTLDPLRVRKIAPSQELIHSLLAVSQATSEEHVVDAPVYGFVHVQRVDPERRKLTLMAPSPGALPGQFLLVASLKWLQ